MWWLIVLLILLSALDVLVKSTSASAQRTDHPRTNER